MKKILISLLVLALLCVSTAAPAEETIKLELNTAKLQVYNADSPYLNGLTENEDGLKVIVISARKSVQLQVDVQPRTVKNRKVTLSVDNEAVVRVKGNSITGQKPGEAVLTIASVQDPSARIQYRIVVVQPVTRIALNAPAKSVPVGGTITLTPTFFPEDATRKQVVWSSANQQIARVDENGVVTGLQRGNARITAAAADGSNIRTNISIQVTQSASEIVLDKKDLTVAVGRSAMLKASVMPKETNNKKVIWSSSDGKVATVNAQGRVTGVGMGECEIICTSADNGTVQAKATVHVQQPVKKVTFGNAPAVYNGESAQLTWTIEPADVTNPALKFTSSNEKILTVDQNGVVTGVLGGEATVTAVTTDGSNRQAKIKVKVLQHLTGVHMLRKTAYIDLGQTCRAGAVLEPEKAKNLNPNMTWESADPFIATARPNAKSPSKVDITGVSSGETYVTGTTEDGGFQASILVKIGDWDNTLKWKEGKFDARGNFSFVISNVGSLNVTGITLEIEVYGFDGKPLKGINTKNGSNVVRAVYKGGMGPGKTTIRDSWKLVDYNRDLANQEGFAAIVVRIAEFEIDHDWIKVTQKNNRQMRVRYDPHKVLR